MIDQL